MRNRAGVVATSSLAFALTAAVVSAAQAQLCAGIPARSYWVEGGRAESGMNSVAVALGQLGRNSYGEGAVHSVSFNAGHQSPSGDQDATTLNSFGGRYYWGVDHETVGLCVGTGLQFGYAYVVNQGGLQENWRITQWSVPAFVSLGVALRLGRSSQLVLHGTPTVQLGHRTYMEYTRVDTVRADEHTTAFGWTVGATLLVGPLEVSAAESKVGNGSMRWLLGAGVRR